MKMKTQKEIEEMLKSLEERKILFDNSYAELKEGCPNAPEQNTPEYNNICKKIELLKWVLNKKKK
jgi:hypothetical protein